VQTRQDQQSEAAFQEWLARYKQEHLDGTLLCHFLSADHLKDAFLAGAVTAFAYCRACGD
jgi:hypothetical protein